MAANTLQELARRLHKLARQGIEALEEVSNGTKIGGLRELRRIKRMAFEFSCFTIIELGYQESCAASNAFFCSTSL